MPVSPLAIPGRFAFQGGAKSALTGHSRCVSAKLGAIPATGCSMYTLCLRTHMPRPATHWPQLAALAQRMKARPSFKLLYQREGLSEWA